MFRYIGNGAFHHGIPKRDLTDAEFEALSDEQKSMIRQGGLYRPEEDEQPAASRSKSSSVTATGSLAQRAPAGKSSKESSSG